MRDWLRLSDSGSSNGLAAAAKQGTSFLAGANSKIVMLRDTAPAIEDSFAQLIEPSQKGLYDRGRISKHNEFTIRTYIRKEQGRKEGKEGLYGSLYGCVRRERHFVARPHPQEDNPSQEG